MSIYSILVHAHSGLRWLVLLFILIAIIGSVYRLKTSSGQRMKDCIYNRLALIVIHLQLVLGLVLYFISPKVVFNAASMKDSLLRFYLVEHILLMILAVVLITVGYVKSDRSDDEKKKSKLIVIYYSIALLLILISIPWPFRGFGAGWF